MDSSDTTDEPKKTYDQKTFFKIVGSFAVAETLVWAAYYYSFAAFFPTWEAELKFSKPVLTGAFTMALVVAAFAAPYTPTKEAHEQNGGELEDMSPLWRTKVRANQRGR